MKTAIIIPNHEQEVMGLIAEGLLLYDKVGLDISNPTVSLNGLKYIENELMSELIENGLIELIYKNRNGSVGWKNVKGQEQFMVTFKIKNQVTEIKESYIDGYFKSIYPKSLIKKIKDIVQPLEVDLNYLYETTMSDLNNLSYVQIIMDYVKKNFNIPNDMFKIGVDSEGVSLFIPSTLDKNQHHKIIGDASYGMWLINEVNYRILLSSLFGQVFCEKEFQNFLYIKLRAIFRDNQWDLNKNFLELCSINEFPDIKQLVNSGELKLEDIIKLRKKHGKALREWLTNITNDTYIKNTKFSHEYIRRIQESSPQSNIIKRLVVIGISGLSNYIQPGAGSVVSSLDSLLVKELTKKWQPQFFFDTARDLRDNRAK